METRLTDSRTKINSRVLAPQVGDRPVPLRPGLCSLGSHTMWGVPGHPPAPTKTQNMQTKATKQKDTRTKTKNKEQRTKKQKTMNKTTTKETQGRRRDNPTQPIPTCVLVAPTQTYNTRGRPPLSSWMVCGRCSANTQGAHSGQGLPPRRRNRRPLPPRLLWHLPKPQRRRSIRPPSRRFMRTGPIRRYRWTACAGPLQPA